MLLEFSVFIHIPIVRNLEQREAEEAMQEQLDALGAMTTDGFYHPSLPLLVDLSPMFLRSYVLKMFCALI